MFSTDKWKTVQKAAKLTLSVDKVGSAVQAYVWEQSCPLMTAITDWVFTKMTFGI